MTEKTSKWTRKRHSAEFKAKVVVAALREDKTLNQLSTEFGVHPVVISQWKKEALVALPGVFGQRLEREAQAVENRERDLFEQIGRLEVENRWLKKKLGPLA
jgi:transposase-like protein